MYAHKVDFPYHRMVGDNISSAMLSLIVLENSIVLRCPL